MTEDYDVDYSYGSASVTHAILDFENITFSQELRFQSRDDDQGRISWIAGGYLESDEEKYNEMSMQYLASPMMNFNRKSDCPVDSTTPSTTRPSPHTIPKLRQVMNGAPKSPGWKTA